MALGATEKGNPCLKSKCCSHLAEAGDGGDGTGCRITRDGTWLILASCLGQDGLC